MSRHVQTNFTAADFEGASGRAKKPARKRAAKKAAAPKAQQDPNQVPDGTTEEVLAWVGGDKAKAKRALDKESKGGDPRVTLVEPLEKLLEEPKAEEPKEPAKKAPAKKAPAKKTADPAK